MNGSSKFEVRSSKQIRKSKMSTPTNFVNAGLANGSFPLTPALSLGEREKNREGRRCQRLSCSIEDSARFLASAATKREQFGFRVLNLIRVSSFGYRVSTACK